MESFLVKYTLPFLQDKILPRCWSGPYDRLVILLPFAKISSFRLLGRFFFPLSATPPFSLVAERCTLAVTHLPRKFLYFFHFFFPGTRFHRISELSPPPMSSFPIQDALFRASLGQKDRLFFPELNRDLFLQRLTNFSSRSDPNLLGWPFFHFFFLILTPPPSFTKMFLGQSLSPSFR